MSEQSGLDLVIKISGAAVTLTNEATTTSDNQTYQITDASKQVLDRDTTPVVKVGGSVTAESYTVNLLNGKVTFATVNASRGAVTVSGKYLPMTTAAYAHAMQKTQSATLMDVTPFGASAVKRKAGLLSMSGSISQFDMTDTTYTAALLAGTPVVIEDRYTSAASPSRVWAILESVALSAAIAGVQDMAIAWTSRDEWIKLGG